MKKIKLFGILAGIVFGLASCGDNSVCSQDDFVGIWVGTEECSVNSTSTDVTITIIKKGSKIEIDGGAFETDELKLDDCSASEKSGAFGTGYEYEASLSGTTLTLVHKVTAIGFDANTCTYTLLRE